MNSHWPARLICLTLLFCGFALAAKPKQKIPKPKHIDPVTITVTGIKNPTILKNVNIAIKTLKDKHITKPLTQISVLRVYKETPQTILNAVKPYGYFNAKITHKTNTFSIGRWHSAFTVKLGPPMIVSAVDISIFGSGKGDKNFLKILDHYPVKKGKILQTQQFTDGNQLLFGHAANLGYFKAKMVFSKIYINLIHHTAKVVVKFDTGIRHHFGKTTFTKVPLNPKFLRKYLTYKIGEPYTSSQVNRTQTHLADANYFDQVIVAPMIKDSVNGITPIDIKLKMRKRKSYLFGLGYSTDTGPRGTLGFIYRWVNAYGHYFDAKVQGSRVNNVLQIAYHIPWPNPYRDLFTFKLSGGRLDVAKGTSNSQKFAVEYAHHYTKWQHTLSLNFLNERYDIDRFNLPKTNAKLIYPAINVIYYSTKNHITPNEGLRLTFDLAGTPKFLSTTDGFAQLRADAKTVYTFARRRLQLVNRLQGGVTRIKNIGNLPLSLQLLAGGSQTIRGFQYQGIGPGHYLFVSANELRVRVWKELYLSGFYDFGNVDNGKLFKHLAESAGPGLVFRSPIGVIGVYAAWRISKDKKYPAFVFSMGPEI